MSNMAGFADYFLAAVCVFCCIAAVLGGASLKFERDRARKVLLAAKAAVLVAGAISVVVVDIFIDAFIGDDFSIAAVARYSSSDMVFIHKLGAVWAGPAGSQLLLACGAVAMFAIWLVTLRTDGSTFNAAAMIIGAVMCFGFSLFVFLVAKPFAQSEMGVEAGRGLSPLLRNIWMLVHPPALVLAYSVFLIPFIVVVASVFGGNTESAELYVHLRRWLLTGVCFLCIGIITGARWAYLELDWGGYWAWDPVQNLSLLPLLGALAALHSINAIELVDKFRRWTLALAPTPFVLCLFLGFVGSSGILKSEHTFGRSDMSSGLLSFACACSILWMVCLIRAITSVPVAWEQPSEYRFAKAKILFWSNIGFVATAAAVGLATLLPVILQVVLNSSDIQISVEFFYRRVIPVVSIGLIFLVGFYRLADLRQRRGSSMLPTLACYAPGIITFGVLYRMADYSILLSLSCAVGVFSVVSIALKFLVALFCREKIAGCFAHFGVVIVLLSAGLSGADKSIGTSLAEGDRLMLGSWEFVYDSLERRTSGGIEQVEPQFVASKGERQVWLRPHRSGYHEMPEADRQSRAAIDTGVFEDVCVSFKGLTPDGKAKITVTIRPFVFWLWLGGSLIIVGSAIGILEGKARFLPTNETGKKDSALQPGE